MGYIASSRDAIARLKARADPELAGLALLVRQFVRGNAPGAREVFFDGPYAFSLIYNAGPKYTQSFAYIAVYKKCVNLGFAQGTMLPDPHRLLTGTGRLMRHVRISLPADLEREGLTQLLDAAVTLAQNSGAAHQRSRPRIVEAKRAAPP
jgi:hypothetical protein